MLSPCLNAFSAQSTSCSPCCLPSRLPPPRRHFHFSHFPFLGAWKHLACVSLQPPLQPCLLLQLDAPTFPAAGIPPQILVISGFLHVFAPPVPSTEAPLIPPHLLLTIQNSAQYHLLQEASLTFPTLNSTSAGPFSVLLWCSEDASVMNDGLCTLRCLSERAPEKGAQGGGGALGGLVPLCYLAKA